MPYPHPVYWLARRFRWRVDYLRTLFFDALRWPETHIPRTDNPVHFLPQDSLLTLTQRGS